MPFADQTHLTRAAQAVDDLLVQLTGDDWTAPTPCEGWSVADVAQHLVEVNLDFARQLRATGSETPTETSPYGELLDGYRRSTKALQQALIRTGDSAVDVSPQLRGRLALRVADLLIHGWDIAVATGSPLRLPEDLCAQALSFAQRRSGALQRSGQFAPPRPIDEHAPAIDRLAALSGRTPPQPPRGRSVIEHDVVIAGCGPTGLMLAGELALAGTDVVTIERRSHHDLVGSRAGGMTSRTLEVLDQRGIVERFLRRGFTGQNAHYSGLFFDISDLPTRHNYGLGLLQHRIESILADWITELDAPIHYGHNITGLTQDDTGVTVEMAEGPPMRARYLIGCDGGRSLVRKSAAIPFPGFDASLSCLVADVELTAEPPWGLHRHPSFHSFFKFEDTDSIRVMVTEPELGNTCEPRLDDIRQALISARGTDYGLRSASWISRFTDTTRQAATYRDRRVLLAGDAAHIHFPIGGQGLNTGIQDAVNLGWKLAQVVGETSPESLLDTYHNERHPVAARVLHNTMAQTALNAPGARTDALRDTITELLAMDQPRTQIAAMMCGLDIHYDLGAGHPLLGRRIPDVDLQTTAGSRSLFTLLHQARPVLLNLAAPGRFTNADDYDRLSVVDASYPGLWHLPVIGCVANPHAVLIRPDGHVAWVDTDGNATGLLPALAKWTGFRPEHVARPRTTT